MHQNCEKKFTKILLLYAPHHKPLLIRNRSWIQAILKDRIFWKNLLKNKEMILENGVKNIQATAYNGVRTVCLFRSVAKMFDNKGDIFLSF